MLCLCGECSGLVGFGCWNLDGEKVEDVLLDSEVINDQAKFDGACCVLPEAGRDGAFCISVGFQYFDQLVFGNFSGLGQTIHALLYLT
mmetsp:Transcript_12552/g.18044  ORF Transcript_12552/g.18044 Transcript_12552/m.18044 type:complete len:88 (-) Transcript_12552:25-288(-)